MNTSNFKSPLDIETSSDLAESIRPVELGSAERDRMRARILERALAAPPTGMITVRADDGAWQHYSPGVTLKVLREEPSVKSMTFLIRMEPGSNIPVHPHSQEELCFMLEGEAIIGDHVIRAGDTHIALPGTAHTQFFSSTGCLILVHGEIRDRA